MVTTLAILNCNLDIGYEAIIEKTLSRIQSDEKSGIQSNGQEHNRSIPNPGEKLRAESFDADKN
jgi:hypothetical protein